MVEKKTAAGKTAEAEKITTSEQAANVVYEEQRTSEVPKTETVANADTGAKEQLDAAKALEVQQGFATASVISVGEPTPRPTHPNDVKFFVEYGTGFKGAKHMPEGQIVVVSSEVGAQFESLGIGRVVL